MPDYISRSFTYDGKRYYVKGQSEKECARKIAEKQAELKQAVKINGTMTVNAWCTEWLNTYVKPKVRAPGSPKSRNTMTQKSYEMYDQKIRLYILPAIGSRRLKDVTEVDLQRLLNNSAEKSFSHCAKLRFIIQDIFGKATQMRLIYFDPSIGLELPAAKKGKRRCLTDAERKAFLTVAQTSKHGTWLKTILYCGLRHGEIAALKVKDIDFNQKLIEITTAVESGSRVIGQPKTAAGIRFVFIPDHFVDELKKCTQGKLPDDHVFVNSLGKPLTVDAMSQAWETFKRQMDIAMGAKHTPHGHVYDPKDLAPDGTPLYPDKDGKPMNGHVIADDLVAYCLRHTYCTDLLTVGVPLETVRYVMGHSDVSTTSNHYAHTSKEAAIKAAQMMSENT